MIPIYYYTSISSKLLFTADCVSGEVRLSGSSNSNEGRVEVCFNGVWGTISSTNFGEQEAKIVCKQSGFFEYCKLLIALNLAVHVCIVIIIFNWSLL